MYHCLLEKNPLNNSSPKMTDKTCYPNLSKFLVNPPKKKIFVKIY